MPAAAQAVPVGQRSEIVVAMASATERAAPGMMRAGIFVVAVPVERVESMHGVELVVQFVVQVFMQVHGEVPGCLERV
jgi:hypothetical protein